MLPDCITQLPPGALLIFLLVPSTLWLLAFFLTYFAYLKRRHASESLDWPSIPGKIVDHWIEEINDSDIGVVSTDYVPKVRYEYKLWGKTYQSGTITIDLDLPRRFDRDSARHYLRKYQIGQEVEVYYDPDNPAKCALKPEATSAVYWLLYYVAAILFVGGLVLAAKCWSFSP